MSRKGNNGPKKKCFTAAQVAAVRKMQSAGKPRSEIARFIGVCSSTYAWFLQTNRFGFVKKRQGRRRNKRGCSVMKSLCDDPETEMLFGCPAEEWKKRKKEVQDSWAHIGRDEHERRWRGVMPNGERAFGLHDLEECTADDLYGVDLTP